MNDIQAYLNPVAVNSTASANNSDAEVTPNFGGILPGDSNNQSSTTSIYSGIGLSALLGLLVVIV